MVIDWTEDEVAIIDKLIFNMMWKNKPAKIKKNNIIGDYYIGGLRYPELKSRIDYLLLKVRHCFCLKLAVYRCIIDA